MGPTTTAASNDQDRCLSQLDHSTLVGNLVFLTTLTTFFYLMECLADLFKGTGRLY